MKLHYGLFVAVGWLTALAGAAGWAAVFTKDTGDWPKDWPAELEPLRARSRTIGIATGIQQDVYQIPILDRETFDKVWPAVLKVRTPGSPITLYRAETSPPAAWGDLLSNQKAAIRIYAPTGGYSLKEATDPQQRIDYNKLVEEGRALRAGPPWPEYLVGEKGELPEFVVAEKDDQGKLIWEAADPFEDQKEARKPRGFYNRARVDVELVIDGQTIDLNQVKLPDDARIIDHRFDEQP